jgi:mRNA interferase MazF
MSEPLRGEVWNVNLDPTKGREQRGTRPALVVSHNSFNRGAAELVVVVPLTRTFRGIPLHVKINPPEGGVKNISYAKIEDVRSVSKERLSRRWGSVSPAWLPWPIGCGYCWTSRCWTDQADGSHSKLAVERSRRPAGARPSRRCLPPTARAG